MTVLSFNLWKVDANKTKPNQTKTKKIKTSKTNVSTHPAAMEDKEFTELTIIQIN